MPESYGANAWIGIGEESTWGTPVARTKFFEAIRIALGAEIRTAASRVSRNVDPQRIIEVRRRAVGDIVLELMYDGYLKLFKHALGDTSTATITAGQSYRHSFVRAAQLPTGLTVETELDQRNLVHEGCKVNQLRIDMPSDDVPSITLSLIGETTVNGSASTPAFPTDRIIEPSFGALTWGGTDYSAHIQSINMDIGNSLDGERGRIGSTGIKVPVRSQNRPDHRVTLQLDHNDTADAFYTDFLAKTERDLTIIFTSTVSIGASADKYKFKIELPKAVIVSAQIPVEGPGIVPMTLEFEGRYAADTDFDVDSNQAGAFKITFDNSESSI